MLANPQGYVLHPSSFFRHQAPETAKKTLILSIKSQPKKKIKKKYQHSKEQVKNKNPIQFPNSNQQIKAKLHKKTNDTIFLAKYTFYFFSATR
jgi:hypothetical protein